MASNIAVYLKWDKYAALVDFIAPRYGLEAEKFEMPAYRELPPVKWSVCDWPERIVIERA